MSIVSERTQYLGLEQIEVACTEVASRLLVGSAELIDALRRELTAVSANGLRSSALGQGLFGPHVPRPGIIAIAGPGGVGKSFFAELVARVMYGERFADHLITVNCRSYFAGRFSPLPRAKLAAGPVAVVALDGVEVLPEMPPFAAMWADAIRYGRTALPATTERGELTQVELSFTRALIIATANVAREQVAHFGFRPAAGEPMGTEQSTRLIRDMLGSLFAESLGDVFSQDRWIVLPPLDRSGMRLLVDLQLASLADLLPRKSPPIEISAPAAERLIDLALESQSPNKTVELVDLLRSAVEPPVNQTLLRVTVPMPLRVRIGLGDNWLDTQVETAVPNES